MLLNLNIHYFFSVSLHFSCSLKHMKRQVNNFKCSGAFCFQEIIISKVRTMAKTKNNEANVMLLEKKNLFHVRGARAVLRFIICSFLCSTL